jgi:hypothetical protein
VFILMKGYKILRILEEVAGNKKRPARCLVEFKKGRSKPVVQWYSRTYANSLFGTDQVQAARVEQEAKGEGDVELEVEGKS